MLAAETWKEPLQRIRKRRAFIPIRLFAEPWEELLPNPASTKNRAMAAYEQALALDPSDAEAHLEFGRLFAQMKNPEKARSELEKVLELSSPITTRRIIFWAGCSISWGIENESRAYMASFEEKKSALMEQSVIGSGFIFGGQ